MIKRLQIKSALAIIYYHLPSEVIEAQTSPSPEVPLISRLRTTGRPVCSLYPKKLDADYSKVNQEIP